MVVQAAQDVLDAEHGVAGGDLGEAALVARRAEQLHARLAGGQRVDAGAAVAPVDLHQHGREGVADAGHRKAAAQPVLAAAQVVAFGAAAVRPLRAQAVRRRTLVARAPGEHELAAAEFAQLQLGHAELVRTGRAGQQCTDQQQCAAPQATPAHFAASVRRTVYLRASSRTAAVRSSDIVASVQSC